MVLKNQYLDINMSINKLLREDQETILSFSCGCEELDKFFHEEMSLCIKHHYSFPAINIGYLGVRTDLDVCIYLYNYLN